VTGLRRAFLAVVPPPDVLRWTDSVADSVRRPDDGLRWTRPEQRHLTLQFLGRVDDPDSLADSLAESVAESVRRIAPFTLALGGAGAFPSARRAAVVWLGVATGGEELAALAGVIAAATAPLGFAVEERPFRPHLTLARSTPARDLRAPVERLGAGSPGPPSTVDHVVLFESDTRADGAVHTERARIPLGGRRPPLGPDPSRPAHPRAARNA
jgi:RNA 2',3'-cyclic 3'-phosphodiesterase